MRLFTYIYTALLSANLLGQESSTRLEDLVRDVDALVQTVAPQQLFDTPEAKRLSEFIRVDVTTNHAEATVRLLQQQQDTKPSWQVAVEAVLSSHSGSEPTSNDVTSLESLFAATIKEGDHWLNHASPRGWTDPYSFRRKLAKLIIQARTGASQDIENELLLRDDPSRWLGRPAVPAPTQSTKQEATNKPPRTSAPSVQKPAPNEAASSALANSSEEPKTLTPWSIIVALIVAAGGLLWLVLKRCMK